MRGSTQVSVLRDKGEVRTHCTGVCQVHMDMNRLSWNLMEKGGYQILWRGRSHRQGDGEQTADHQILPSVCYPITGVNGNCTSVLKGTVGTPNPWTVKTVGSQTLVRWLMAVTRLVMGSLQGLSRPYAKEILMVRVDNRGHQTLSWEKGGS